MANTWRLPPELFYPAARFWEKAEPRNKIGCWPWRHAVSVRTGGYAVGAFHLDGGRVTAPRMAWLLSHGPIPNGMFVLHRCDNALCVRPDHLRLGTQAENMADVARGRSGRGERHSQAVLTDAQVIELRRRRAAGESAAALAREFSLKPTTCRNILRGQSYRYLPMPGS